MAKLNDLIAAFSATGLDDRSIRETARRLREAGKIKTGRVGRGGGAEMDHNDAAAMLIALTGCGDRREVIGAAQVLEYVEPLTASSYSEFWDRSKKRDLAELEELFGLSAGHTFLEAVSAVLRLLSRPTGGFVGGRFMAVSGFEIAVRRPLPEAKITFSSGLSQHVITYRHPEVRRAGLAADGTPDPAGWAERQRALDTHFGGNPFAYSVERAFGPVGIDKIANVLRASEEAS